MSDTASPESDGAEVSGARCGRGGADVRGFRVIAVGLPESFATGIVGVVFGRGTLPQDWLKVLDVGFGLVVRVGWVDVLVVDVLRRLVVSLHCGVDLARVVSPGWRLS